MSIRIDFTKEALALHEKGEHYMNIDVVNDIAKHTIFKCFSN